MRISHKIYALSGPILILLHTFFVPVQADEVDQVAMAIDNWQYNRLFNPSPVDREAESQGAVFIYDGLTDVTVKQALDQHFGRIQNMMFTRTVITDENGDPQLDPITGNELVEDDGC
ncbi:MAG: hypothetical protein HKM94_06615 [Halobacteria archaeon]|nr:hypothetical protein [Halobacteria archaeon]